MMKLEVMLFGWLSIIACSVMASDLQRARDHFHQFEFEESTQLLQTLNETSPGDPEIIFLLAQNLVRLRDFDAAQVHLQAAIRANPDNADYHYLLGITYISLLGKVSLFKKLGHARKARENWEHALEIDKTHLQSKFALTSFYLSAPGIAGGDTELAQLHIEGLDALHKGYAALARGMLNEKREAYNDAEKYFAAAIELISERASPYFNLANFYLRRERYAEALTWIDAYQSRENKLWDDPAPGLVLLIKANIKAGLGEIVVAHQLLKEALILGADAALAESIKDRIDDLGS